MKTLVLGGNKSGKSGYALELLMAAPAPRSAIVTGSPLDLSFRARILDHKAARNPEVTVREVFLDLPGAVEKVGAEAGSVLVDCLDFWIFSWLNAGRRIAEAAERLTAAVQAAKNDTLILVSCEIGLGPLAADRETRAFADALGTLNQAAAKACDETYLVVAGRALKLG